MVTPRATGTTRPAQEGHRGKNNGEGVKGKVLTIGVRFGQKKNLTSPQEPALTPHTSVCLSDTWGT